MKKLFTFLFLNTLVVYTVYSQGSPGDVGSLIAIDSYTGFQGYDEDTPHIGQGEYQIFYDNIDGILDKPIIICDGFDPEDSRDINTIYSIGTYGDPAQNIFDNLRDEGLDVVVLNFPNYTRADDGADIQGGADYIERNGLVLVNLIETIKTEMSGTQDLIVIGPSMGGLITRYALTYMEQNALDHQTAIWLSFDSPHRGANVPISFQYAVNYFAEYLDNADMAALRDVQLNSVAAKQMLLDHYSAHLQDGESYLQDTALQLPLPNEYRTTFMTTMDGLGFPQQTRNLAIINGSLNGTMTATPGATLMDGEIDPDGVGAADVNLHFTPAISISDYNIDHIEITAYGVTINTFNAVAASPTSSSGLDSAPGGTVLFDSYFGSNPSDLEQQVQDALMVDAFDFIPTMSSLAVDEPDWYHSVNGSETTPFDNYIGGNTNQPHLTLTEEYAAFLMDEFASVYLSTDPLWMDDAIRLLKNPVENTVSLRLDSNRLQGNIHIQMIAVSGQLLGDYSFDSNQAEIHFPSPSVSGLYWLKIDNNSSSITKKLIVK